MTSYRGFLLCVYVSWRIRALTAKWLLDIMGSLMFNHVYIALIIYSLCGFLPYMNGHSFLFVCSSDRLFVFVFSKYICSV